MSSLDDLFVGDPSTRPTAPARPDGRLDALVGSVAPVAAPVDHAVERERLGQLVGDSAGVRTAADARAVAALPAAASTRTKARSRFLRRQRRDWLALATAAAAIIAIAGASFVGVRAAVASTPTDDARTLLTFGEEALASSMSAVNAERKRFETTRTEMLAAAEQSAATLVSLAGVADEGLRQGAIAARDAYAADVKAISLPASLKPFEAEVLDDDATITEIGAALDSVNARQLDADAAQQELRDLRKALESKRDAYRASAAPLADSMLALAATSLGQHTAALPEFRGAVQNATNAFTAARTTGRVGWGEMQALGAAIAALRADDERALSEGAVDDGSRSSGDGWNSGPGDVATPPAPGPGGGATDDSTDGGSTDSGGSTDGDGSTDGSVTDGGVTDGSTDGVVPLP
ncbi:hypothetical protein ACWIBQ_00910 [Microbacterium keratanolyticum]